MSDKSNNVDFKRLERQLSILNEVGKTLISSLDIKDVLQEIMRKVGAFFEPDNWSLLLLDEAHNELYFEIVVGEVAEKIKDVRIKIGEGVAGWVAQTGEALFIPNVNVDPRFSRKVDEMTQFSTQSIICVPLKIREKVLGVIELINKRDIISLHQYDLEILITVADYAAIALENASNYQRVQQLTITDDITGLYNSRYIHNLMQAELDRSKRFNLNFSVVFFDLDFFKLVNDSHGHLVGTQLLAKVGKLIAKNIRKVDRAARYGGDEFIIMLPQTSKKNALVVCKRFQKALNKEMFFREEGFNIKITASFGIATFPEDADTKDQLLQIVDDAMYQIKNSTRDGIALAREQKKKKNG